ncbi:MAG: phosphoribosyltransferase [Eudoraea sp.]|nr:phosphoribosyltransferase [Eudoraea sp.]
MYENRTDAGKQLAEQLRPFIGQDIVVLAIPRGGLPVGAEVAAVLNAPLDVVLTKKIGHPHHKEYAIGAVSMDGVILSDTETIPEDYIIEETARIREVLRARHGQYYRNRNPLPLKDKVVIIVDDGIATGNTLIATVQLVAKQKPSRIIVGIPVAPRSAVQRLEAMPEVDEVVCLATPLNFMAVGQFYLHFYQVSDKEAITILEGADKASP